MNTNNNIKVEFVSLEEVKAEIARLYMIDNKAYNLNDRSKLIAECNSVSEIAWIEMYCNE
jgi:hypothetical protein